MALDLNDKTGNGNTLTNNNGATENTSDFPFTPNTRTAVLASASTQWLSAADANSLDLATTGTLQAWMNFTSTPSSGSAYVLLSKDNQSTQRSYATFLRNSGGTLRFEMIIFGNSTDDYYFWNYTPSTGTWYQLTWTVNTNNASATTFELFVNGVSQGNGTAIDSGNVTTITNSTAQFGIGAADGGLQPANMKVDDVRVWNIVRSAAAIAADMNTDLHGTESGLVAYWPFEVPVFAAGGAFLLNFV